MEKTAFNFWEQGAGISGNANGTVTKRKNKALNETMWLGQESLQKQSINEDPEQGAHLGSQGPSQDPPGLNRNTTGDHWKCEDGIF